jgi:hypothetical protein
MAIVKIEDEKKQVMFVQQQANELVVASGEDMERASDLRAQVKMVEKAITDRKELITRPLMTALASARDLFKPLESGYIEAKKTIDAKMLAYTNAEYERIQKEKDRVAARVEKGTMRADTAINKLEAIGEVKKSIAGESSKVSIRNTTKVRIIDESLLPREFMLPNVPMITEALLKKNQIVPGAETYIEKTIAGSSR